MFPCRHCGSEAPYDEPVRRDAECAGCGRDLRSCVQCRHYDPAFANSCRETEAEPVVDEERRNFCGFYSPNRQPFRPGQDAPERQAEARARLAGLFGGAKTPDRAAHARAALESLFRKPDPKE